MSAYYNENDPFAAAWLRELISDGLIAPGFVDERSIEDVLPSDLEEFTQCHFFAGIGVWSLALRVAGWPDDCPVWTGSCPCQPFSTAGKGAGFADERHLWPAWFHLIACGKRRYVPVLGEQVASKDGRAWFDLVSGDMESLDHTCGAVDTSAASLGAPFIGQRLYWLASANGGECERRSGSSRGNDCGGACAGRQESDGCLAIPGSTGRASIREERVGAGIPLHPVEYWRDADWLLCRDPNGARFRPVEPGAFPLVDARTLRNRLGAVRGAGNALNISQAACFVEVVMEYLN